MEILHIMESDGRLISGIAYSHFLLHCVSTGFKLNSVADTDNNTLFAIYHLNNYKYVFMYTS